MIDRFWICLTQGLAALSAVAAPEGGGPDQWLSGPAQYPEGIPVALVDSDRFAGLRAEAIAGRFKVVCPAGDLAPQARVTVFASADEPGHWRARDWQAYPAERRGALWDATVPVDDVEVPVVYFAVVGAPDVVPAQVSPMRVVKPNTVGLEEPSRVFTPFLEGFEEGLTSWRLLGAEPETPPLRTKADARSGRAALCVTVPAGKRSATVATTCVRGRHLVGRQATGVRVWLRALKGAGRARFTLEANAYAPDQVLAVWPQEASLTEQWHPVDLFFQTLPQVPLAAVDLFAIEFIAAGPCEFLVDDVQLLVPGRLGPD